MSHFTDHMHASPVQRQAAFQRTPTIPGKYQTTREPHGVNRNKLNGSPRRAKHMGGTTPVSKEVTEDGKTKPKRRSKEKPPDEQNGKGIPKKKTKEDVIINEGRDGKVKRRKKTKESVTIDEKKDGQGKPQIKLKENENIVGKKDGKVRSTAKSIEIETLAEEKRVKPRRVKGKKDGKVKAQFKSIEHETIDEEKNGEIKHVTKSKEFATIDEEKDEKGKRNRSPKERVNVKNSAINKGTQKKKPKSLIRTQDDDEKSLQDHKKKTKAFSSTEDEGESKVKPKKKRFALKTIEEVGDKVQLFKKSQGERYDNAKQDVASIDGSQPEKKLEDEKWYHGIQTRDDIAPFLRDTGDFVVRVSQEGNIYTLVLNVKNGNEIDNLTLSLLDGRYTLHYLLNVKDNKAVFDSVSKLIKYYRKHRLPNGIRLLHGVKRPSWLIPHNSITYNKNEKLGSGNFCDVFRGKVSIENDVIDCAVKICHPPHEEVSPKELLEARISMINEVKMMVRYRDDNLIKFYGVACDRPPIMILMELCNGGSLDVHLRKRGPLIFITEKLIYLYEASHGMRYLHSVNCVHRDLAARNCLISKEGTIKVSDFGLSVILESGKTMCRTIIKEAPIRWFAPECCYKKPQFSKKTDVWAFGTMMFEVFSNGSKPFLDYEDLAIIRAIRKANMPPPPTGTPTEAAALLKRIWTLNPDDRPTFHEIGTKLRDAIRNSPPIEPGQMIVNQLKGVKREKTFCPKSAANTCFSLSTTINVTSVVDTVDAMDKTPAGKAQ